MVMVEGGAVRRFFPCATYETKTVSSPLSEILKVILHQVIFFEITAQFDFNISNWLTCNQQLC